MSRKPVARMILTASLVAAGYGPAASQFSLGGSWESLFTPVGPAGPIHHLRAYGRQLVAGGNFSHADDVAARNIASWDGTRWNALADGLDGTVYDLAASGDSLYMVGAFDRAGPAACPNFAVWDGKAWSTLGDGSVRRMQSVALHRGQVYIGGMKGSGPQALYKWNGTAWEQCGKAVGGEIFNMVSDGSRLWLLGNFSIYESQGLVATLAFWDGQRFQAAIKPSQSPASHSMAAWHGSLFNLGPAEISPPGRQDWVLRRWTDSRWDTLTLPTEFKKHLRLAADPDSARLFLAGHDGINRAYLAEWEDSAFAILGGLSSDHSLGIFAAHGKAVTQDGYLTAVDLDPDARKNPLAIDTISATKKKGLRGLTRRMTPWGRDLLLHGWYEDEVPGVRHQFARLQPTGSWSLLPYRLGEDTIGSSLSVRSMLAEGEDLYLGGAFDSADGTAASNIAHWDGKTWNPLGEGHPGVPTAMIKRGSDLLVASIGLPAGPPYPEILYGSAAARWDGKAWSRMGAGLQGDAEYLAEYDGMVYFGGRGLRIGGSPDTLALVRWTGQEWQRATDKDDTMPVIRITQLAATSHGLYAVADVENSPFITNWFLVHWDGKGFERLRRLGTSPKIASDSSRLYVWGASVIGMESSFFESWDGKSWSNIGKPPGPIVGDILEDMAVLDDHLYIAHFTRSQDYGLSILRWNIREGLAATIRPRGGKSVRPRRAAVPSIVRPIFPGPDGGMHDGLGRRLP